MSRPDHSLDPLILESAKKEFMDKGFEKASLKEICENANVTTGALYKRYSGKEDLFCAVVKETVEDMENLLEEKYCVDFEQISDEELIKVWEMDEDYMMWWFRFLYERYDGFVLLLKCSEGTCYSNFQHDWVEKMTSATYTYYLEIQRRHLTDTQVSESEMHILLTAFWATIYEPFIHGYTLDQLGGHCKLVCNLFDWKHMFRF
ncbi:TetR/AcrR family transcriptional regulator [Clostridium sporogenes]|uniref:TetR/AcrR family transcriptional regulator n=1 Tax=Clostridium sporogenes TaxID=1509 RepID=UPI002149F593|nr:TetR/AcrR family transcriptional regulator [Clostridium sporogenes]EKS4344586.1 TetR/AcrR family transcriptional regulator [Clostridium botulinum]EKS4395059.1 TetR/AcrR family transcriptional regulator [Clostridium botulinum]MCR1972603.1 TetR/AcrR family transcriptional regulator [Clostridium sporogenes]MCW6077696.1 TetR/AcrR family transcriptional regulator [Clostridium sporogenes]MDU1321619.1 TetR/AcrR family transcriptional regulator [Clostridium botulinum]